MTRSAWRSGSPPAPTATTGTPAAFWILLIPPASPPRSYSGSRTPQGKPGKLRPPVTGMPMPAALATLTGRRGRWSTSASLSRNRGASRRPAAGGPGPSPPATLTGRRGRCPTSALWSSGRGASRRPAPGLPRPSPPVTPTWRRRRCTTSASWRTSRAASRTPAPGMPRPPSPATPTTHRRRCTTSASWSSGRAAPRTPEPGGPTPSLRATPAWRRRRCTISASWRTSRGASMRPAPGLPRPPSPATPTWRRERCPRAAAVLTDFYGTKTSYAVSVLDGIKSKIGAGTTVKFTPDNVDNAAVKAAQSSEVAIVVVGNDPMCGAKTPWEAFNPDASSKPCPVPGDGREGRDRESIDLPDEELIKQVYAVNPKTVVVLVSSFPYAISWSKEHIPAILHITHAAQEQGTAIADVLFGDYNPAGRLVQTWPKSLEQLPPLMDYDIRHGRTYMYFKGEPLFPFGYGLSYSTFEYSNLQLSSPRLDKTGNVAVGVQVENTGKRAGEEVIQFYVRHTRSSVSRPSKELKGFRRVKLQPDEKKTVTFSLAAESLAWWNEKSGGWEVEAEPVELLIGSSSADIQIG